MDGGMSGWISKQRFERGFSLQMRHVIQTMDNVLQLMDNGHQQEELGILPVKYNIRKVYLCSLCCSKHKKKTPQHYKVRKIALQTQY